MADKQEYIGSSFIQHGPDNDRVYLMKLSEKDDAADVAEKVYQLAVQQGYSKIFAKVPASRADLFLSRGYREEGRIPCFYQGETGAVFLGNYLDPERMQCEQQDTINATISLAESKAENPAAAELPPGHQIRLATADDAESLASIYRTVFASYPFPIHSPDYLRDTMKTHIRYYAVFCGSEMAAASSAEMDRDAQNAEMTDFATLPEHRGKGLAVSLLHAMEPDMHKLRIKTLYTIARAMSPGMNITFAKCGYKYGGTLVHNTQISGRIESMNLWYKN